MFRVISILTVLLFLHQHVLADAVLDHDPVSAENISPPSAAHLNKLSTRQDDTAFGVVVTAGSVESSAAHTYGTQVHVISDLERDSFELSDANLKRAVEAYVGRAPNDAYLTSPTPWGDLYTTYLWDQVAVTVTPIDAEALDITSTPTIVKTQTFDNNSDDIGDFTVTISDTVANNVTSTWTGSDSITVGQKVNYQYKFIGTGASVGGETSFSYQHTWGQGGSESDTVILGSTVGVVVQLQPGESVTAVLNASKGSMRVKVTYRVTLSGQVAVNYNPTFENHHFWAYDVNAVLRAGGLPTELIIEEELQIGYYSDSSVELLDR